MSECKTHGAYPGVVCPGCYAEFERQDAKRRAYQQGYASVNRRGAECPYAPGSDLEADWEEGRNEAEVERGDEYAQYCDPSCRDLYE